MESIRARQRAVQEALDSVQEQLFELENKYLDETSGVGNVVRGWDGYIDSKPRSALVANKKDRRLKPSERIFSYSSVTSPIPPEDIAKERSHSAAPSPTMKRSKSNAAADGGRNQRKKKRKRHEDPDY